MANFKNTVISDAQFRLPVGDTAARPGSPNARQIRFNAETGKLEQFRPGVGDWIAPNNTGVIATGGDSVYDVDVEGTTYRVHVFTSTGTSTFSVLQGGEVEYLIVAGGGSGGGRLGGGGGAGGLLTGNVIASNQTYNINVGSGGSNSGQTGSSPSAPTSINDGDNSEAFGLTAIGGGAGGSYNSGLARDGGSGGGAHTYNISTGGTGLQPSSASGGSGNDGGDSTGDYAGGGGGGAGAPGGDGQANGADVGGVGGNGLVSFLTGTAVFYAGGGGGCSWASAGSTLGKPGLGGGGTGAGDVNDGAATAIGEPGLVNTGGGGGGAGYDGNDWLSAGAGGDGIVIIRYPLRQENPVTAPGRAVEDGLVLDLDFAKPTVYNGSGSVVTDSRLNGIEGDLVNGPAFINPRTHRSGFSFRATNNQSLNMNQLIYPIDGDFTVFFSYIRRGSGRGGLFEREGDVGGIDFGQGGTGSWYFRRIDASSNSLMNTDWSYPIQGEFYTDVARFSNSNTLTIFRNGVFVSEVTGANQGPMSPGRVPCTIAVRDSSTYHNLDVFQVLMYARALTSNEIQQHFNTTRWRFGV